MTKEIIFPGIEEYMAPYYGYFHRSESRELAECYLAGLLMDGTDFPHGDMVLYVLLSFNNYFDDI